MMNNNPILSEPTLIKGGKFSDERGMVYFINDFDMSGVKRGYKVVNSSNAPLRAWQAHKVEEKWFVVTRGSFRVYLVPMHNWEDLSENTVKYQFDLTAESPAVLHIPAGYANGFLALSNGAELQVYSSTTLEEAKDDQYKFPAEQWQTSYERA